VNDNDLNSECPDRKNSDGNVSKIDRASVWVQICWTIEKFNSYRTYLFGMKSISQSNDNTLIASNFIPSSWALGPAFSRAENLGRLAIPVSSQ
jgi:hypothetical protein